MDSIEKWFAEVQRVIREWVLKPTQSVQLVDLHKGNEAAYLMAQAENEQTQKFRFQQSQARWLLTRLDNDCLIDSLAFMYHKSSLAIQELVDLMNLIDWSGFDGWITTSDWDAIVTGQVKLKKEAAVNE